MHEQKNERRAMSQTQMVHRNPGVLVSITDNDKSVASSTELAAGIIHDVGNLIQVASSAVNIVARNPRTHTAELEPIIAGAKSSLERAGALVRKTFRVVSTRAAEIEVVSVADCLCDIESLLRITWENSIRLDFRIESDLPLVKCDPLALQNAVLNLLLNARDAMPNGGVISVRAAAISFDFGEGIELLVADNGVGMKPDTIVRAFDSFFTTKPDGMGGVGLPMVKRFVQESGGHIRVESEYGLGTTVRLQLPAFSPPPDNPVDGRRW
jgi:signal transduction histidine kinase